jgi:hypothetical protein
VTLPKKLFKYTCLYSGFCFRFFPHFKILNLTPGSDKRTIIWRCLTTAAAFSSGLNRKLKNEVDALEQYGRRSLIRISGIPEPTEEGDTTEKVI